MPNSIPHLLWHHLRFTSRRSRDDDLEIRVRFPSRQLKDPVLHKAVDLLESSRQSSDLVRLERRLEIEIHDVIVVVGHCLLPVLSCVPIGRARILRIRANPCAVFRQTRDVVE